MVIEPVDPLDLRLEVDDISVDLIARELQRLRIQNRRPPRMILRPVQVRSLMREGVESMSPTMRIHSILGIPITELDDDLTPRERSVKRALREFPPTRDEQVAAELERREQEARDRLDAHGSEILGSRAYGESLVEATRKLGEAARAGSLSMDAFTVS